MRTLSGLIVLGLAIAALPLTAGVYSSSGIVRTYHFENSGTIDVQHIGAPTFYYDFDDDAGSASITDGTGNITMTVNGFSSAHDVFDGTYPVGLDGTMGKSWDFDGDDYLNRSDDGTFEATSFTLMAVVTPEALSGQQNIIGKWTTVASQLSWVFCTNSTSWYFYSSESGSDLSWCSEGGGNGPAIGEYVAVVLTFDGSGGSGAGVTKMYFDGTTKSCTSQKIPYNGTGDLYIGKQDNGNFWNGKIHYLAYWSGIIATQAQADILLKQWTGKISGQGTAELDVASTAPPSVQIAAPDSGLQPFFANMNYNTMSIGNHGFWSGEALTNLARRASFETWGAGSPTGWTETVDAGDGTADVAQSTSHSAHLLSSAEYTLTGTTSTAKLVSACLDIDPAKNYQLQAWAKKISGTSNVDLVVTGYSDATCESDEVTELTIDVGDAATDWTLSFDSIAIAAWEGTTEYVLIQILNDSTAGENVVVVDGVSLRADRLYPTDSGCFCDTDTSCACNHVIVTATDQPFSGNMGWEVTATYRSPWPGSDGVSHSLWQSAGTSGNTNSILLRKDDADNLALLVYDSGGSAKISFMAVTGINWAANTDHTIITWKTPDGRIGLTLDGVPASDSSAALTTGAGVTITPAGGMYGGGDVWVRNWTMRRRLTQ